MQLIKSITALFLVFVGQGNIFIQHYFNQNNHSSHAKISMDKPSKQSVSRLPKNQFNLKNNFLEKSQENDQFLEIRKIEATTEEFIAFNFNSIKPIWFGCCGEL